MSHIEELTGSCSSLRQELKQALEAEASVQATLPTLLADLEASQLAQANAKAAAA